MNTRDRLRMMQEIERRNQEHIEVFKAAQKPALQQNKRKAKRNRGKHKKRP